VAFASGGDPGRPTRRRQRPGDDGTTATADDETDHKSENHRISLLRALLRGCTVRE
jgi:hypothetical protein